MSRGRLCYVDGVRFDQMLLLAPTDEVEQACRSAGEVLAAIHRFTFTGPSLWTFLERAPDDPAILRDVRPLHVATVAAFAE
jgi:hypothetical protein